MAIKCPVLPRRADTPSKDTRGRNSYPERKAGPLTRPTSAADRVREQMLAEATQAAQAAYDAYQLALAELRALDGPVACPTVDPNQLRFTFADAYVTTHLGIVQPTPAMYGPWSSRMVHKPSPPKRVSLLDALGHLMPEEYTDSVAWYMPVRMTHWHSRRKSIDPQKRMEQIFDSIHQGEDAL